jgi:hypothetical protein
MITLCISMYDSILLARQKYPTRTQQLFVADISERKGKVRYTLRCMVGLVWMS